MPNNLIIQFGYEIVALTSLIVLYGLGYALYLYGACTYKTASTKQIVSSMLF